MAEARPPSTQKEGKSVEGREKGTTLKETKQPDPLKETKQPDPLKETKQPEPLRDILRTARGRQALSSLLCTVQGIDVFLRSLDPARAGSLLEELRNVMNPHIKKIESKKKPSDPLDSLRPIVFLNLETTQTDEKEPRICRIDLLKFKDDGKNPESIIKYVNPGDGIKTPEILPEGKKWEQVPKFSKELGEELIGHLKDCNIGGYNIRWSHLPVLDKHFSDVKIQMNWKGDRIFDSRIIFEETQSWERCESAHAFYYPGVEAKGEQVAANILRAQVRECDDWKNLCASDMVDLGGKFRKNQDGTIIMDFGRHKGATLDFVLKNNKDYIYFLLDEDRIKRYGIPVQTSKILRNILRAKGYKI